MSLKIFLDFTVFSHQKIKMAKAYVLGSLNG